MSKRINKEDKKERLQKTTRGKTIAGIYVEYLVYLNKLL